MSRMVDGGAQWHEHDIDAARYQLWFARLEESGALRAAGRFLVDPDKAQACIDELTRIVTDVRLMATELRQTWIESPGYDEVSMNATRNAQLMTNRAEAYVTAWAAQIEATRDALRSQLESYLAVDADLADRA